MRLQTIDPDMFSVLIFQKRVWHSVSPLNFVCDFSRNIFLMLHSINQPNSTAQLPLLLETIVCFPVCGVINFEIDFIFLIKPFFYLTKKSCRKIKIFEDQTSFKVKEKAFFIIFKELSVSKNCLRTQSVSLIQYLNLI